MATVAQISANRVNALSSTGPKTPAGIANSKLNAIRHGLTSQQIVIKGEDPAAYDAFRAQLVAEHNPRTESQGMLVEQVAQNWWRLSRARRIESKMIEQFGEVEAWSQKPFLNLMRHLTAAERSWKYAVNELARLKRASEKVEEFKLKIMTDLAGARPAVGFDLSRIAKARYITRKLYRAARRQEHADRTASVAA